MAFLVTTLGPKAEAELGMILPHEHIFANFRTGEDPGVPVSAVVAAMLPEVERAKAVGVTAMADATAVGGARRADVLRAVSEAADFPILAATGIFKEPFKTHWVAEKGEDGLADWMTAELTGEIEGSGVCAGWIKLSAGDDGLTDSERVLLRAAARAGRATGAAVGSHTIRGWVAREQLDVIEAAGYSAERFIWVHTQMEDDFRLHLEIARRGAWLEYDAVGDHRSDDEYIAWLRQLVDAGLSHRVLLSHDRGWYDPTLPEGGPRKSYTYISEGFLPRLRAAGFDDALIRQFTHTNPFRAYAR